MHVAIIVVAVVAFVGIGLAIITIIIRRRRSKETFEERLFRQNSANPRGGAVSPCVASTPIENIESEYVPSPLPEHAPISSSNGTYILELDAEGKPVVPY